VLALQAPLVGVAASRILLDVQRVVAEEPVVARITVRGIAQNRNFIQLRPGKKLFRHKQQSTVVYADCINGRGSEGIVRRESECVLVNAGEFFGLVQVEVPQADQATEGAIVDCRQLPETIQIQDPQILQVGSECVLRDLCDPRIEQTQVL